MTQFQKNIFDAEIVKEEMSANRFYFLSTILVFLSAMLFGCSNSSVSSIWESQEGTNLNNSYSNFGGMKGTLFWQIAKSAAVKNLIMDQSSILYYQLGPNQVEALNQANTATPSVKWTYTAAAGISTPLSMDDDYHVFFGCADNNLYEVRDGALLWQFPLPSGTMSSAPLVSNGSVYVGASDGTVYSLNYSSKTVNWSFKTKGLRRNGVVTFIRISNLPCLTIFFNL
jgi:outer membrane protein assembly factor BamB